MVPGKWFQEPFLPVCATPLRSSSWSSIYSPNRSGWLCSSQAITVRRSCSAVLIAKSSSCAETLPAGSHGQRSSDRGLFLSAIHPATSCAINLNRATRNSVKHVEPWEAVLGVAERKNPLRKSTSSCVNGSSVARASPRFPSARPRFTRGMKQAVFMPSMAAILRP